MTTRNVDEINRIMEFLTRNDSDTINLKNDVLLDAQFRDNFLSDSWPTETDDLLDNIFSLEDGPLGILEQPLPDLSIYPDNEPQLLASVPGSSCSDSGLSSDQADLDGFDQQLSPFLIQNSCDDDVQSIQMVAPHYLKSEKLNALPEGLADDQLDIKFEPVPFVEAKPIVKYEPFQITNARKRRSSQIAPNMAIVQPKIQKATIKNSVNLSPIKIQKPQLIVAAQPQKQVKVSNIQVINPQPKILYKTADNICNQHKVIRVAPIAGNPRSIVVPVTIKDMKDLRSIKIINASDLKNASNIKLAAANLLSQTKMQEFKAEPMNTVDFEYDSNNGTMDDSNSEQSSDEGCGEGRRAAEQRAAYPRLSLSPEERKLLAKEGIQLPASYPLTKHEERELKRIRRKIRNKISAQDSRKRKKEYVDGLEDRVKQCTDENQTLIKRIKILQSQNQSLTAQLKRLQGVLSGGHGKAAPPATCLLVLLMSVALVALPSLRDADPAPAAASPAAAASTAASPAALQRASHALRRALLSANLKTGEEEVVLEDGEFNMEELVMLRRDHDYPRASPAPPAAAALLPGGYLDLPVDEDWPPGPKRRRPPAALVRAGSYRDQPAEWRPGGAAAAARGPPGGPPGPPSPAAAPAARRLRHAAADVHNITEFRSYVIVGDPEDE